MMKIRKQILVLISVLVSLLILSCQREYTNPWDEKTNLDPFSWAPKNLQIEDISITDKSLSWEYANGNIEGFRLDRKIGDNNWQLGYQTFSKYTRSWSDTDVIPENGVKYLYRLYAYAGNHKSASRAEFIITDFPTLTNLQLEKLSDKSIKLTWVDNSNGEQGYKIDRCTNSINWDNGYGIVQANKTEYIDSNLFVKEFNIIYRVYAFYDNYESNKVMIYTNAELIAPTNLQLIKNSISSVTLSWQDNSNGEDGFNIERRYEGGSWEPLTKTTDNSFEDTGFDLNTRVYYRVCAFVGNFSSTWVEIDFDATIPAPENLQFAINSTTSITLNWNYFLSGHEGFKIDRKVNESNWEEEFASMNVGQTSFTDDNIDLQTNDYYYRVYAFYQDYNSLKIDALIDFACGFLLVIDPRDGNEYETVQIGNQCWMKENIAYLPSVSHPENGSQTTPYYYVNGYEGTNVAEAKTTENYQNYGVLYNWPAALTACPEGWTLPSDDEWTQQTDLLGGQYVAGGKMKSTRTAPDTHPRWDSPNYGATNESGWSGLPGGYRHLYGYFINVGNNGFWWSLSESSSTDAWRRVLSYNYEDVNRFTNGKEYGFSVRCLRD